MCVCVARDPKLPKKYKFKNVEEVDTSAVWFSQICPKRKGVLQPELLHFPSTSGSSVVPVV